MLKDLKALLVTCPINIKYLTGFDGSFGWCLVWMEEGVLKKFLITDARYQGYVQEKAFEDVEISDLSKRPVNSLREILSKLKIIEVGFEMSSMTFAKMEELKKEFAWVTWIPSKSAVEDVRKIKSIDEIKLIQESQKITKEIFEQVKLELEPGMTEREIAWKIGTLAMKRRCDGLSFDPIVAINDHSSCAHHKNTDRKFQKGDMLLVDMGVIWKGHCSDMTRMIFTKEMTPLQREVYELVESAQQKAIEAIGAGVLCKDVDAVAREAIEEGGYGSKFCHSLGHGVGMEIHEKPTLSLKSTDVLEKGMVVTVEPGIYLEGKFGVRIEDLVFVS